MIERHAEKDGERSTAWYSPCETYRYGLRRVWDGDAGELLFVMLNPSTASELQNDPTIERCQRRTKALGFGGMRIANLFAFRATRPEDLRRAEDPEGPENADLLRDWSTKAEMTLAAWGVHGDLYDAGPRLAPLLAGRVCHLGLTKAGHPRHPLYVAYSVRPEPWPVELRYAA
ncbi:DUF1643 domain-containing protein [Mameliella alba]|nr:DUF1643 domain-containing protein [Antarctobacter heliothermus]MBY6145070.1 DUF1643 domain-containing protein [Mameliella alba]MBY6160587.1 DUF1643 domain-containing protein [Mameliella alba]MBY6169057.1 DUF1643 domain-containing protein [Mameliella alba]MBY6173722.1 DUF1643 domain-containing protein [Mameliella alba]